MPDNLPSGEANRDLKQPSAGTGERPLDPIEPTPLEFEHLNTDRAQRAALLRAKLRWSIARQVRDLRKSRGLNQKQLAAGLGWHQSRVSYIENPAAPFPLLSALTDIGNFFDCAFHVKFTSWSEWLAFMQALKAGQVPRVPSFIEELEELHAVPANGADPSHSASPEGKA